MGPRTFVAKKAADFLLDYGNLNERVLNQITLEHCIELQNPTAMPWWQALTYSYSSTSHTEAHDDDDDDDDNGVHKYHTEIILVASFIVARELKKHVERKKKNRPYLARAPSKLSNCVDEMTVRSARSSLYLAAVGVVCDLLALLIASSESMSMSMSMRNVHFVGRMAEVLEESQTLQLQHYYYFYAFSLWSILISIILTMASVVWSILDPRSNGNGIASATNGTWCKHDKYNAATVTISTGVVLWLAYTDLPLLRMLTNGQIQIIDFGLPQEVTNLIKHCASSFVGFCIFHKLLPNNNDTIDRSSLPANDESAPSKKGAVAMKRTPKKPAVDPEVVKRMSMLASEARERFAARKSRGTNHQMRRTFSEGNLARSSYNTYNSNNAPSTPQRRRSRQNSLTPLPEHKSPLNDIYLAGPTLSSRDLMAKLKGNGDCIKHSVSSGCLEKLLPHDPSFLMPPPLAFSDRVPNLAEEEKVHEDGPVPVLTPRNLSSVRRV